MKLGALVVSDDGKVQCHICGRLFVALGSHVWQGHGLSADQYRAEFQLMCEQPLCSKSLSGRLREVNGPRLTALNTPDAVMRASQAARAANKGRRRVARLQEINARGPEWIYQRRQAAAKAAIKTAKQKAEGTLKRAWPEESKQRQRERRIAQWRDPVYREEMIHKLKQAHPAIPKDGTCAICGNHFQYSSRAPRTICQPSPSPCFIALKQRVVMSNAALRKAKSAKKFEISQ